MSLSVGKSMLLGSFKDLKARWEKARMNWDDSVSHELEEGFLVPLERDIRSAVSAMERMAAIVGQAKRDCS